MNILVTGGNGYIGSHTCVELLNGNHNVIVVDNFSNSKTGTIGRIEQITGKKLMFYNCDIRDKRHLTDIFIQNDIEAVIHFAGLKSVNESINKPLLYFDNNVGGTVTLCEIMEKFNVKKMVFSSSATVYGDESKAPYTENMPTGKVTNPYGRTKYVIEEMLKDIYNSSKDWSICILRYFNPIGAHESGIIGEEPIGVPNNVMPFILQVANGTRDEFTVYGGDYDTHDGTCVRDYIHVVDLARGHLKAVEKIGKNPGLNIYNMGTSRGYSVLELINEFEKASGTKLKYKIGDRRGGDIDVVYANTDKACRELGFKPQFGIEKMCKDAWNWQKNNL